MTSLMITLGAALILLTGAPPMATAQARPIASINVSVKGDRLAFASIGDYKRAVDQPSEQTKAQLARLVGSLKGFTSLAERQKSLPTLGGDPDKVRSLIRDEYFASILNPDLVVQIGDHMFRISPSTESVYALSAMYEKEYKDLIAENTRNSHIQTFSTSDDVLELIQANGAGPSKKLSCNESGIGGRHAEVPLGSATASADFVRYGLYFSLFASIAPWGSSGFPYTFDFTGGISANKGHVYYHVRCGSTADYDIKSTGSWMLTNRRYQSYQGSKNLNAVYFFFRVLDSSFARAQPVTPYVGFRVNK